MLHPTLWIHIGYPNQYKYIGAICTPWEDDDWPTTESYGYCGNNCQFNDASSGFRPVIRLISTTKVVDGDGSISSPYKLQK